MDFTYQYNNTGYSGQIIASSSISPFSIENHKDVKELSIWVNKNNPATYYTAYHVPFTFDYAMDKAFISIIVLGIFGVLIIPYLFVLAGRWSIEEYWININKSDEKNKEEDGIIKKAMYILCLICTIVFIIWCFYYPLIPQSYTANVNNSIVLLFFLPDEINR